MKYNVDGIKGISKKAIRRILRHKDFYLCIAVIVFSLIFTRQALGDDNVGWFWKIGIVEVAFESSCFFVLYKMQKRKFY